LQITTVTKKGTCEDLEERQKLLIATSEGDDQKDEKKTSDPLLGFSVGIISYRTMLRQLIFLFGVISILVIPCMRIYGDNPEIKHKMS